MADKQKTIDIIFGGIDKTGTAIKSVGGNLQSLERNVGSVTGPLSDITGSILKLDAAIAAAAIGLTAYGIKVADDFGTSFAEISTLIGQPASELQSFKDDIQDYAEQSGQSFESITGAIYNAISAGVDYRDSIDLLKVSEELALAGRADLDVTTKALVSTMNAFGAGADEAAGYADVFFTTVQKGQTTLPELADSIGRVAPLAAQAGLDFDELGAAIAAITAGGGISTAEAMTALSGAISNLIKPSKQASDLAAMLGIDFNAAALESKGLAGVLDDVKSATNGNVDQMAKLFGNVRALNAVLPLTGTASGKFSEALELMETRTGRARSAAKELETDLGLLGQTLQNNVTSAFISFGNNLTDETAGIIESTSSMFGSLGDEIRLQDGSFAPLIGQLEGVFQDIESKFAVMAENLPEALKGLDFTNLVGAFDDLGSELGDSFRAIFGEVDLTTVEGLESALQTVVDAFAALVSVTSGIIDGLEPLFALIGSGAEYFNDLSSEQQKTIGQTLGLASALDAVLGPISALATGLKSVGVGLVAVAGVKGIPAVLSQLGSLSQIAATAGKTGLAGAALFGAAGVGAGLGAALNELFEFFAGDSLGVKIYEWVNGDGNSSVALDDASQKFRDLTERAKELSAEQQRGAESQRKSTEARNLDIEATQKQLDAYIDSASAHSEFNTELEKSVESQTKSVGAIQAVNDAIAIGGDSVKQAAQSTIELAQNSKNLTIEYDQATGKINSWSGAMENNGKALDSQVEKTKAAIEQTAEYQMKLLELASDERIASIEAAVSLDIAQLESDTKQAVAIIEGLSNTVTSTGDVLGALWGTFNDASRFDQLAISKEIEKESKNREKALDQSARLTEAQIQNLQARTKQIAKGDALIKVSAENLSPALELIFNEILGLAQIRATQDGIDLLLGA